MVRRSPAELIASPARHGTEVEALRAKLGPVRVLTGSRPRRRRCGRCTDRPSRTWPPGFFLAPEAAEPPAGREAHYVGTAPSHEAGATTCGAGAAIANHPTEAMVRAHDDDSLDP